MNKRLLREQCSKLSSAILFETKSTKRERNEQEIYTFYLQDLFKYHNLFNIYISFCSFRAIHVLFALIKVQIQLNCFKSCFSLGSLKGDTIFLSLVYTQHNVNNYFVVKINVCKTKPRLPEDMLRQQTYFFHGGTEHSLRSKRSFTIVFIIEYYLFYIFRLFVGVQDAL